MKTYNNGPRKGMMYGGAAKRKPMMYGGMTKPRKKAQAGGKMSATQPQQNMMQNQMMPVPAMTKAMDRTPMAMGGKSPSALKMVKNSKGEMVPFYAADGKGKS
tara:strand:- start:244 stop:552 length:309 start_codon:yes stop_codon:yes gene_type:complete